MLKGADIVLQCLRAEGVDLVFGYPGGAIMPLYDALEGSGVRHILTRHEQGAVFAAEGYARVTGKVGVAMATSGPGATNLVTGIADAKRSAAIYHRIEVEAILVNKGPTADTRRRARCRDRSSSSSSGA